MVMTEKLCVQRLRGNPTQVKIRQWLAICCASTFHWCRFHFSHPLVDLEMLILGALPVSSMNVRLAGTARCTGNPPHPCQRIYIVCRLRASIAHMQSSATRAVDRGRFVDVCG